MMFGLNKIALYLIIATFLSGALGSAYYVWKKNIEHAALLEFNKAQMEQTLKDQQKFIEQQQQISDQTRKAVTDMQNSNVTLRNKIMGINSSLDNISKSGGDRPSSSILKDTVRQLRALQQQEEQLPEKALK
jgi:hypothetical protein